jgi:hypothetical protein
MSPKNDHRVVITGKQFYISKKISLLESYTDLEVLSEVKNTARTISIERKLDDIDYMVFHVNNRDWTLTSYVSKQELVPPGELTPRRIQKTSNVYISEDLAAQLLDSYFTYYEKKRN